MSRWRVLIVEDDRTIAALHHRLVSSMAGFRVVAIAESAEEATRRVAELRPDLILLDLALPGADGLALLRALRAGSRPVEVIVVSATRAAATVRASAQLGVVDYLIKPFAPDRLRQALGTFLRRVAAPEHAALDQAGVDALRATAAPGRRWLPRELSEPRLDAVRAALADAGEDEMTADEIAAAVGTSRVTARRYLEYLVTTDEALQRARPGPRGRPCKAYRLSEGALAAGPAVAARSGAAAKSGRAV